MKNYDLTIVIDPNENVVNNEKEKIKGYIETLGGSIVDTKDMGVRQLGYEIKKRTQGYFHVLKINFTPSKVTELEREFRLNENILKFMTTVGASN